jgi:ribonuclease HII
MQQAGLFEIKGLIAGVDEAGRGPLAGPVVAGAVILAPGQDTTDFDDSKRLGESERDALAVRIRAEALAWSVAWADRAEIDTLNILQATMLAMRRAILGLRLMPDAVQVDGNRLPNLAFGAQRLEGDAIVRGDGSIPAISAASILAKTARDRIMVDMDSVYPAYGFARHKGYGTALHNERLRECGPCPAHRYSFAPVKAAT